MFGAYHASWPESIHYSLFTNNSCVPPGADGYSKDKGCSLGGLPQYIVNATTEEQISEAMAWASKRDIRIVIKSTGHDFNGRYVLSVWAFTFVCVGCSDIKSDQPGHTPFLSGHAISITSSTTQPGAFPEVTKPQMY